ncbi:MAG: PAS domain S-box protein, partial [Magnetococcales bacterium]|nr:PAS domain S-box protein [Magnetococcales bacterium]
MTDRLERRPMLSLILVMAAVGLVVGGVTLFILYETSLGQTQDRLQDLVRGRARLIEAMFRAQVDHLREHSGHPEDATSEQERAWNRVLAILREAQYGFHGMGETGEFLLGRRMGDDIVFLLHRRHDAGDKPLPIPYHDTGRAEPMRQAVDGKTGWSIGPDYRGVEVLAVHGFLEAQRVGIVGKLDMAEVRRPYLWAGLIALGLDLLVILTGVSLFFRVSAPMLRRARENELMREQRQQLEETRQALQEKAIYLDSILESASDLAIVATDGAMRVKYCNHAVAAIHNVDPRQVIGRTVDEIHQLRGVDEKRFAFGIRLTDAQGGYGFEARQQRPEGECIITSRVSPIRDQSGKRVGYVLIARDITVQRQAHEALQRSERRYRLLMESANDAILVADAKTGMIVEANAVAELLLQRPQAEIIGLHQTKLHPFEEREHYATLFREHVQGTRDSVDDVEILRPDGSRVPVEIRATVINLGDGQLIQGIFRDVTEHKLAEQRLKETNQELERRVALRTRDLERSNRDLQQFAYVASHDLQEPLRLVAGFVQLLEKRYSGQLDDKATQYIAYVVDGVKHMEALINSLLSYARVGTQGEPLAPISCDAALDRALRYLTGSIAGSGAIITRTPLPTVLADENQLAQVFQNLIHNAIKFHGETAPEIDISHTLEDDTCVVAVRDNGIGIDPQYAERIFIIFQ